MKLIANLLVNGFAVFLADYFLEGIYIKDFKTAIIVALVLGILNTFLKPILELLAFPLNLLTLGFFRLLINVFIVGFIVFLASWFVSGFIVSNFFWAVIFSIFLSIINWIFNLALK
jgi:putative membrane protein